MGTRSKVFVRADNTPVACTVTSSNPGGGWLIRWTVAPIVGVTPGSDSNNMNQVFSAVDTYGVPTMQAGVAAPTYVGNVGGLNIPDTSGFQCATCDSWIAVPAGITSVIFRMRAYGNTAGGLYAGLAPKYAKRIFWQNAPLPSAALNIAEYPELCGRKVIFCRSFAVNGYFHGGHFIQISTDGGATFVDVTGALAYWAQPYQLQIP